MRRFAALVVVAGVWWGGAQALAQPKIVVGQVPTKWNMPGPFQESLCLAGNFPPTTQPPYRAEHGIAVGKSLTLSKVRVLAFYDGFNEPPPRLVYVEATLNGVTARHYVRLVQHSAVRPGLSLCGMAIPPAAWLAYGELDGPIYAAAGTVVKAVTVSPLRNVQGAEFTLAGTLQ